MNNIEKTFSEYVDSIASKYKYELTSEMGYRTEFEILMKNLFTELNISNIGHDDKAIKGSKPDYVIYKDVPLLYIEVKDIGVSLDKIEKSEQMSRYYGYDNLVLTDYTEFRFYRNGTKYQEPIFIAKYDKIDRSIKPIPENFEFLAKTLIDFTKSHKEPIKSGLQLAKIMGGKGQRIRDNILELLSEGTQKDLDLDKVYKSIKQLLVHDLDVTSFADMYAQTLVYGLFVARFHDESSKNFSRIEARDLIPASNPFLRHFFDHIAGSNFNKRLEHIVDELCEVFSHSDIERLLDDYYRKDKIGENEKGPDPVIHFYEDFLKEYDPVLRKKMGAYYTPQPIVEFIVRSVDLILKKDFGLKAGLADTSKTDNGIHRVQVLDPAVGTGTFYSKIIGQIYKQFVVNKQQGRWPKYVHNELLPRIHGFELMMAPYTIAHLKLSLAFKKTGFKYFNDRLGIYLTNSLEDIEEQQELLAFGFAESIANESKEASKIKRETPIMVVVGNPPYSVSSQNKGKWIEKEVKEYKKNLNEKNIQPLSDDYIKFIRFAEYFVEKNGSGIVAMITNNSFIDGIIHRQMRKHLLETFDDIYVLDLHGNSKKREIAPDGSKDENVFDIMQGVSINIFVKLNIPSKKLAKVFHNELYGKRTYKFNVLNNNNLNTLNWKQLKYTEPYYFFVPKDFSFIEEYENGFKVNILFKQIWSGVKFRKDSLLIKNHYTVQSVKQLLSDMQNLDDRTIHLKYDFKDTNDWKLEEKRKLFKYEDYNSIIPILYRPFDIRYTYYPYEDVTKLIPRGDSRKNLARNMLKNNIGLIINKQVVGNLWSHIGLTTILNSHGTFYLGNKGQDYTFPLYLYSEDGSKATNFDSEITNKIKDLIGEYKPEELLDYIFAILHSFNYRERYKEFLKIDFPRIPYPTNRKLFDVLVKVGAELRGIHLMESEKFDQFITSYNEPGSDEIEKIRYENGNVYINNTQYFGNVPEIAWNFYIGGYQPAKKWLKDRKGKALSNEDIEHYQKIIIALMETNRLMKKIDKIIPEWPIK